LESATDAQPVALAVEGVMAGNMVSKSSQYFNVCAPALDDSDVWLEPCAGGANTSLQATPRPGVVQIVADVDPLTANVWRVFTSEPLALQLLDTLQSVDVSDTPKRCNREFQAATACVRNGVAQSQPFDLLSIGSV
jgi:hypothetical protein